MTVKAVPAAYGVPPTVKPTFRLLKLPAIVAAVALLVLVWGSAPAGAVDYCSQQGNTCAPFTAIVEYQGSEQESYNDNQGDVYSVHFSFDQTVRWVTQHTVNPTSSLSITISGADSMSSASGNTRQGNNNCQTALSAASPNDDGSPLFQYTGTSATTIDLNAWLPFYWVVEAEPCLNGFGPGNSDVLFNDPSAVATMKPTVTGISTAGSNSIVRKYSFNEPAQDDPNGPPGNTYSASGDGTLTIAMNGGTSSCPGTTDAAVRAAAPEATLGTGSGRLPAGAGTATTTSCAICPNPADDPLLKEVKEHMENQTALKKDMNLAHRRYQALVKSIRANGGRETHQIAEVKDGAHEYEKHLKSAYDEDVKDLESAEKGWLARAKCPATKSEIKHDVADGMNSIKQRFKTDQEAPELAVKAIEDGCECGGF
jgi:hypothetical protein